MVASAPEHLAGVLLAAGASERMGRPKALLRMGSAQAGGFLIVDQARRLLGVGCARVACVLGADAIRIESEAGAVLRQLREGVTLCRNKQWQRGPFSSLQCGLEHLGASPGGVLVLPVDVPGVSPEVFMRILSVAAMSDPSPDAVVPTHGDRGGHPVWLSPATIARVLAEDAGGRLDLLLRTLHVVRTAVDDARVRLNVNSPEEWDAFRGD